MHQDVHPEALHHPHGGGFGSALMRFEDYCFAYDDVAVLSHVDLAICAGDSVVLMGDNGSGKSTLLRAMAGLALPQQGSYRFDGEAVDAASMADAAFAKRLHQRVGLVFQDSDAQLFCATVADELAFGPRQMGLSEGEVDGRVSDVCDLLGTGGLLARAPYNLSGGEKRKVAIACTLTMNPDVLCLDEPMAGLDEVALVAARPAARAQARGQDARHRDARPVARRRTGGLLRLHGRLPRLCRPPARPRQRMRRRGDACALAAPVLVGTLLAATLVAHALVLLDRVLVGEKTQA